MLSRYRPVTRVGLIAILLLPGAARRTYTGSKVSDKGSGSILRWAADNPACTLSIGKDGKYRYGMKAGDTHITVAIDPQELQLVRRRIEPLFAVGVIVDYFGNAAVEFGPKNISLEFLTHSHLVRPALDAGELSYHIQRNSATLERDTSRNIARNQRDKEAALKLLQQYQHDSSEMLEFVETNYLRPRRMDALLRKNTGWVFFNVNSKWFAHWEPTEAFLLRIALKNNTYEFPFDLPPEQLMLRRRQK